MTDQPPSQRLRELIATELDVLERNERKRLAEAYKLPHDSVRAGKCNAYLQAVSDVRLKLDAALAAQEASPRLDVVSQAMSALETGSTHEQREQAWNGLRDTFFPVEEASPQPEIARAWFEKAYFKGVADERRGAVDFETAYLAARRQEGS